MKRYYFERTERVAIIAVSEEDARAELKLRAGLDYEDFTLTDVTDD